MKYLILILLALLSLTSAQTMDSSSAPFGLTWGSPLKASLCSQMSKDPRGMTSCHTSQVPKPLSFTDEYFLTFHPTMGLVRAGLWGKTITDDVYGIQGKDQYQQLRKLIVARYNAQPTKEVTASGDKVYRDSDEFYECLAYSGCGLYLAIWEIPPMSVSLELQGVRRGIGFVIMKVEGPNYNAAKDLQDSLVTSADLNAL